MKTLLKSLACVSIAIVGTAASQTTRQLDAHSHGEAMLSLVIEGNQMGLTVSSPAASMAGFEHAPKNTDQQEIIDGVKETLANVDNIVELSPVINCAVVESDVEWTLDHDGRDEHEEHADHKEHEEQEEHAEKGDIHSEFLVDYLLQCDNIDQLNTIEATLLDKFPAIEKLRVEALLPQSQIVDVLTQDKRKVTINQ